MQSEEKDRVSGRLLFGSYCVGAMICLLTQLVVMMQRGPRVYASLLWGFLYPIRLFITETLTKVGYTLHIPIKSANATWIGVGAASAVLGLIVPALVGLTRSGNRPGRYVGFALIGVFALLALFWGVLPNVL